ncbi:MAG TPA: site-specific integrase [Rhizobiaceae bacterium]|nr:site-specific integrase [Rhizobiaceae bacterium]
MVMVELKGLHTVKAKGRVYYYAWRGGPRIQTEAAPGTPDFMRAYNQAIEDHRAPDPDRFRAVVKTYRKSPDYLKLATSTQRNWSRWLDRIEDHFGELRIAQFNRTERIRQVIRKWRGAYAATPRNADYAMQVLSRVCAHGVDPQGKLVANPCEGIKHLYDADRSEIIWTETDIVQLEPTASEEIKWAVQLAANTGLRMGDLVRLSWSHVHEHEIILTTGKSRHKREAVIPLHDDLRALLKRIPRRSTAVLTSSREHPWTENGLGSSFNKAKIDASLDKRDLHFHDLRGTAVTRFYIAGLSTRVIAEIMAWEETTVERIIRRYVDRKAATLDTIRKLRKAKRRT